MTSYMRLKRLTGKRRQRGQGMTEYIIITALVALAAIGVVGAFGGVVQQQFSNMSNALAGSGSVKTPTASTSADSHVTMKSWGTDATGK